MNVSTTPEGIVEKLGSDYDRLLPLFNYLKARLKYDTVRWIRAYGTKDDIVFSTRIKTFDRVYDKLVRKAERLTKQSDLLDIILSGRGILDDLVGIRFICFDAYHIYRLVSYFLITERVVTSQREFYVSSKANLNHPIYRFLQSHGFTPIQKPDREYEDINFIIRFAHPIDKYFSSGLEQFASLAQQARPPQATEKLATLNTLFDQIRKEQPDLIRAISQFPIECQVVTATQHIYNRTQRPHYEYILQAKGGESEVTLDEIRDLSERLDLLKLNLLAIDQNVYSIHQKFGINYDVPSRIHPGDLFKLAGRLPRDILGENSQIEAINTQVLPILINPESNTLKRRKALDQLFDGIERINQKILDRAQNDGDIIARKLLSVDDLEELSHPEIVFWTFQRIVLLILCVILLYASDKEILRKIVASLTFGAASPNKSTASHTLADPDIVIARLFEKLEHIDHAIHSKLSVSPTRISKWREEYFSKSVFSDPLIQWRYASFMYRRREYRNALQETNVGIAIYDQLEDWKRRGVETAFPVPERPMFIRRRVEYELCAEISELKFGIVSVAGILEFCNNVLSHQEEWNAALDEVIQQSNDLTERAWCHCFKILFSLCSVSAGGLGGDGLEIVRQQHRSQFDELEKTISRHEPNSITDRTWWLLAKSIMSEQDSVQCMKQFSKRIREVRHHTLERKQFDEACYKLISLWIPEGITVSARSDFAGSMLALLKEQTDRVVRSEALSQMAIEHSKELSNLLTEVIRELSEKGKIDSQETIQRRIRKFVSGSAEHIAVDTAVAGLRSILSI